MISSMQEHDGNPNPKARDAVRGLISEIVVSPTEENGVPVEVKAALAPRFQTVPKRWEVWW